MLECVVWSAGWRINEKQCELEPATSIRFLEFVWDSVSITCSLSRDKATNLVKRTAKLMLRATTDQRALPTKLVHSLVGKLTAAQQAVNRVRELLRLPLRVLRRLLLRNKLRGAPRWATPTAADLLTWRTTAFALQLLAQYLRQWNGRSLLEKPMVLRTQSDASPTYCGAVATWVAPKQLRGGVGVPGAAEAGRESCSSAPRSSSFHWPPLRSANA